MPQQVELQRREGYLGTVDHELAQLCVEVQAGGAIRVGLWRCTRARGPLGRLVLGVDESADPAEDAAGSELEAECRVRATAAREAWGGQPGLLSKAERAPLGMGAGIRRGCIEPRRERVFDVRALEVEHAGRVGLGSIGPGRASQQAPKQQGGGIAAWVMIEPAG